MDIKALKKRHEKAQQDRDHFQPQIDEAYEYAIPFRRSSQTADKGRNSNNRSDRVFDQTAITAAFRFAGSLQEKLWPTGQQNFGLEPGPLVRDATARDQLSDILAQISSVIDAFFQDGEWDNAFAEMALDLSAGTGCMFILKGTRSKPVRFITVPLDEVLFESSGYGDVSAIFWKRKWSLRQIKDEWPKANLGQKLGQEYNDNPEKEITLCQDVVRDPVSGRWDVYIYPEDGEHIIEKTTSRTKPCLTPRYYRVSGETMGRGVVQLAMPTIKTLNTASRIQLQAAAIAMLGIYTVVDDGVFNPDLSPLEPGKFWKVARNGGVLGPTVSRFPDPRIDLSNLILGDMRSAIKATMMDQNLPPDTAGVRSASEIMERVRHLASDHVGAFGRLVSEIVVPVVQRVIEIAYELQLIPYDTPIDQLLTRVKITSPLGISREMERVQVIMQWLEMVISVAPNDVHKIAKRIDMLIEAGRALGVDPNHMVSTEERRKIEESEQQQQALALAAAAAAEAEGVA
jgi:hypothetical protein